MASRATVLTLGDNAYPDGTAQDFEECYEPTWGQFKERTRPVPGNHEYHTDGAKAYFDYFGEAAGDPEEGYYSYDLGSWHIVALNSNCGEGEIRCGPGSAQCSGSRRTSPPTTTRGVHPAYFHHPLFTSGKYRPGSRDGGASLGSPLRAGVDVVLNGHDHNYQRFAPRTQRGGQIPSMASGSLWWAPGAGATIRSEPIANTEVYNDDTYGVLNSPCARRATSGSSSLWRARPSATPARPVPLSVSRAPGKGALIGQSGGLSENAVKAKFAEFPFHALR